MSSFSSIGLGLSVVFGCLMLALIAEIYYLLWWKRRIIRRDIENDYINYPSRKFLYMLCWKQKPPIIPSSSESNQNPDFQFHVQTNKDHLIKPSDENGIETQLMSRPLRFLFTIKEETRQDLESEDGKSREGKGSLCDSMKTIETPYLTPFSSPTFVTPPLTPLGSCQSGYNPLYEASSDAEFIGIIKSSPSPKFKFAREAEEKLQRKTMLMEEAKRNAENEAKDGQNKDGSFINFIVAEKNGSDKTIHFCHSPHCHS